jgi:hypothetical protein
VHADYIATARVVESHRSLTRDFHPAGHMTVHGAQTLSYCDRGLQRNITHPDYNTPN